MPVKDCNDAGLCAPGMYPWSSWLCKPCGASMRSQRDISKQRGGTREVEDLVCLSTIIDRPGGVPH
jgi:hypothetical protein